MKEDQLSKSKVIDQVGENETWNENNEKEWSISRLKVIRIDAYWIFLENKGFIHICALDNIFWSNYLKIQDLESWFPIWTTLLVQLRKIVYLEQPWKTRKIHQLHYNILDYADVIWWNESIRLILQISRLANWVIDPHRVQVLITNYRNWSEAEKLEILKTLNEMIESIRNRIGDLKLPDA